MDAPGEVLAAWKTDHGHTVQIYRYRPRRALSRRVGYGWRRLDGDDVISRSADPYDSYETCRRPALQLNPPLDPRSWTGRR
jgi:hypothetical protein